MGHGRIPRVAVLRVQRERRRDPWSSGQFPVGAQVRGSGQQRTVQAVLSDIGHGCLVPPPG